MLLEYKTFHESLLIHNTSKLKKNYMAVGCRRCFRIYMVFGDIWNHNPFHRGDSTMLSFIRLGLGLT